MGKLTLPDCLFCFAGMTHAAHLLWGNPHPSKPSAHAGQEHLFVFCRFDLKIQVGAPMHPFRLRGKGQRAVPGATQLHADRLSPMQSSV
jgi:hypothetical protein